MHSFAFEAIGTSWEIQTARPLSEDTRQGMLDRIEAFDVVYSRFRPDSLAAEMSRAETGGVFRFPADAVRLFDFDLYDRLHTATSGAADSLVGRDLELLGYDAAYTLRPDVPAIARYSMERRTTVAMRSAPREMTS
jgi:thiamine biosynthesis lipoprotein